MVGGPSFHPEGQRVVGHGPKSASEKETDHGNFILDIALFMALIDSAAKILV